jgi:hypothetical protein
MVRCRNDRRCRAELLPLESPSHRWSMPGASAFLTPRVCITAATPMSRRSTTRSPTYCCAATVAHPRPFNTRLDPGAFRRFRPIQPAQGCTPRTLASHPAAARPSTYVFRSGTDHPRHHRHPMTGVLRVVGPTSATKAPCSSGRAAAAPVQPTNGGMNVAEVRSIDAVAPVPRARSTSRPLSASNSPIRRPANASVASNERRCPCRASARWSSSVAASSSAPMWSAVQPRPGRPIYGQAAALALRGLRGRCPHSTACSRTALSTSSVLLIDAFAPWAALRRA